MLRVLVLVVTLSVLYRLIRWVVLQFLNTGDLTQDHEPVQGTSILPCKHCGVFTPEDQTVFDASGNRYCSKECRDTVE